MRSLFFLLVVGILALTACSSDKDNTTNNHSVDGRAPSADLPPVTTYTDFVADHNVVASYEKLPATLTGLKIFYSHTSHGSQLITGLDMLAKDHSFIEEGSGDLGSVDYDSITRSKLGTTGNGYNVVMWSWCGQVSDATEESINTYLQKITALENKYPAIKFVYMTGHLDGEGDSGNLRARNKQIRDYCKANKKILFDFEDIELYDPAGTKHSTASDTDACQWCTTWCSSHTNETGCTYAEDCAHSHCFNCYRKGKALWWLLARFTGWTGQ